MAPQTYGGPTALAFSKYASPSRSRAPLSTVPAIVSSSTAPPDNTIATREQIAASHDGSAVDAATQNPDAQLAAAQGVALKEEVDKHAAKFSRTVSSAITNTRRLLELIREAVQKEDPSTLKTFDNLWAELEQLFAAAKNAKDALPNFLEKQRNNMALYHSSMMNETFRESQDELDLQHKKVSLQHGLILEHQQAFQDYKAQTASKLKEIEELQERVSRLTLEKGHFRGEIDKYAKMLELEQATRAEDLKTAQALQKELETIATSKKQLLLEVEGLEKTINELHEKVQVTKHEITARCTIELQAKSDMLEKESIKTASLNAMVNTLKEQESSAKQEMAKAKAEVKTVTEKYSRMVTEHSQTFSKNSEQIKKIEALTIDAERLRKEGSDMITRLAKIPELEKSNATLFKEKADLLEQVGKLSIELKEVKDNCVKINKELATLTDKLGKVQKENDVLKMENSNIVSNQTELKARSDEADQAVRTASLLKSENVQLKTMLAELRGNQTAPVSGEVSTTGEDKAILEEKVRTLEEQEIMLKKALEEWTELAKRTYGEYKAILPTYKKADQLRQSVEENNETIKNLEHELSKAKASQANGVGAAADVAYWKNKYDGLLSSIGG